MAPATTAVRDATAVMVKDRCMVKALDFEQQGARTTGENMRNMDITAMSKGAIAIYSGHRISQISPQQYTCLQGRHIILLNIHQLKTTI
jgi:hypothetical protein